MANPTIRGDKAIFKIFQDGEEVVLDVVRRVSVQQDSSFKRKFFVGNPVPEGDQSFEGWSGSIDMEVRNSTVDQFIDALVTNNLNGIGISDYSFIVTEEYSDGTRSSYVYFDIQFRLSTDYGGLGDEVTKRLDFQAATRQRI